MKQLYWIKWYWNKNSWKIENIFSHRLIVINIFCLAAIYSWIIFIEANFLNLFISFILNIPLFFKPKYLLVTFVLIFSLIIIHKLFDKFKLENYEFFDEEFIVTKKTNSYYYLKNKSSYFISYKSKYDFELGDKISASGKIKDINVAKNALFLKSEKIKGIIDLKKYNFVTKVYNFEKIINDFTYNKGEYYKKYFNLLTFGYSNIESEKIFSLSKDLGILHLIIISGFHFNIIFQILKKTLKILRVSNNDFFPLLLLTIYFILIAKSPSTIRAYFSILIVVTFKKFFKIKLNSYAPFLVGLCAIIWNPFIIVKQGFWYSYLITIFIFDLNIILKKVKSKILKYLIFSLCIYLISMTIGFIFGNSINVFGFFNILLLTPVCEFLIINNLLFWWFVSYINFMYKLFDLVINLLDYLTVLIDFNFKINFILVAVCIYFLYLPINLKYFEKVTKKNL